MDPDIPALTFEPPPRRIKTAAPTRAGEAAFLEKYASAPLPLAAFFSGVVRASERAVIWAADGVASAWPLLTNLPAHRCLMQRSGLPLAAAQDVCSVDGKEVVYMVLMKVHRWFYRDPTTGEWRLTPHTMPEAEVRRVHPEAKVVPWTEETRMIGGEPFCAEMPLRAAA